MVDYTYSPHFQYTHDNPYHHRLQEYAHFVLRDREGEDFKGRWNHDVFQRTAPLAVEIGSGYGEFMAEYCRDNPEVNFVGMDYRFKRSFGLARRLDASNPNKNFRYLRAKGERLEHLFAPNEIDRMFYFFPDPWPRPRQHKKRLFCDHFLNLAYEIMGPGGKIYIKTDHDDYALWMKKAIERQSKFKLDFHSQDLRHEYPEHFLSRYITKFETIFIAKGTKIKAFVLSSTKELC